MTKVLVGEKLYSYEMSASGIGAWVLDTDQPFVVKEVPAFRWTKQKIPFALWQQILSFFAWTYSTTKSESQVRLLFNSKTGQWAAHAFPQTKGTGMTTRELWDHPNRIEDSKLFADYDDFGTVHHHCSASAFQSGVDSNDERNRVGLHLTVGKLDEKQYDLHSRVVFRQSGIMEGDNLVRAASMLQSGAHLIDWFALPEAVAAAVPEAVHSDILMKMLVIPSSVEFPARWKENLIEEPARTFGVHTPCGLSTYVPGVNQLAPRHITPDFDERFGAGITAFGEQTFPEYWGE